MAYPGGDTVKLADVCPQDEDVFLTWEALADLPQPAAFRVGDRVQIIQPRYVIRVGYEKSVRDYLPTDEMVWAAAALVVGPLAMPRLSDNNRAFHKIQWALAHTSYVFHRPRQVDRGIVVRPFQCRESWESSMDVIGRRIVQIGTRVPSCGSGEDYASGYLYPRRDLTLLRLSPGWEVMAIDCEKKVVPETATHLAHTSL